VYYYYIVDFNNYNLMNFLVKTKYKLSAENLYLIFEKLTFKVNRYGGE